MHGKSSALFQRKIIVPSALLAWLLVSLTFTLLVPRADAAYEAATGCPSNNDEAMDQVYSSQRFRIINLCQKATATVTYFEKWSDGDWNVYVRDLDKPSLWNDSGRANLRTWEQAQDTMSNTKGDRHLAADMIFEAIPRDLGTCGNPGDLGSPPSKGNQITVHGVYVTDKWHSWTEIHPITQITNGGTTCTRSSSDSTSTSSSGSGQCKETWGWGGRDRCK